MKKLFLIFALAGLTLTNAQEVKQIPTISVSGEGKIKVTPDQVSISIAVVSKGTKAVDVKKENDTKIDAVIKYIKKMMIDKQDYQTQRVYLNDQYDYEKKKHNYVATQSIEILLKDLSKYDELMEGLVDSGINNINGVEFKSSKLEIYKSEARKQAMKQAQLKATDYVSVLGQKVGKAIQITDNTSNYYPQPRYKTMEMSVSADSGESRETLAAGEIEVISNVNVNFILE
ncbi:MAG: SIMPL domain-containing protein [Flavobacterium sp.]